MRSLALTTVAMPSPQGPAAKDWNDGYVQTPYFSGHGAGVHYDVNSTSQQNLSELDPRPEAAQVCARDGVCGTPERAVPTPRWAIPEAGMGPADELRISKLRAARICRRVACLARPSHLGPSVVDASAEHRAWPGTDLPPLIPSLQESRQPIQRPAPGAPKPSRSES